MEAIILKARITKSNQSSVRHAAPYLAGVTRLWLNFQEHLHNMSQPPPPNKLERRFPRNPVWDLVLLLLLSIATSFLFIQFNLTEALVAFANQHEEWQLDEIFLAVTMTLSIYAVLFGIYRWRDARLYAGQAFTDSLTGLYNRRILTQLTRTEIERADHFNRPFSLIMFDLDNFKTMNDTYGHDYGDRILQQVAAVVQPELRAGDILARWGGDEFMILATNTDLPAARTIAERVRMAVEGAEIGRGNKSIRASFGVCEYHKQSFDTLLRQTDQQLYRAKRAGRNAVAAP